MSHPAEIERLLKYKGINVDEINLYRFYQHLFFYLKKRCWNFSKKIKLADIEGN